MKYSEFVDRTASGDTDQIRKKLFFNTDLIHSALGLATETGEFLDSVKKWIYYDSRIDYANLLEELGDILWYMQLAINWYNKKHMHQVSLDDLIELNKEKLKRRYPNGFDENRAKVRDVNEELKAFESFKSDAKV